MSSSFMRLVQGLSPQMVVEGDSAEVLRGVADCSIHAVVSDPPHGLFFMCAEWDRDLPADAIWNECFRVLKPGGHVFVMSSERLGCVAGLYMSLRRAGFLVDETQLLNWVSLTGMPKSVDCGKVADKEAFRAWLAMHRETVTCPNHKEPIDPVTKEKQRCVECERIFCEGNLTHHDKRKAESAAVNGDFRDNPNWRPAKTRNGRGFDSLGEEPLDNTEDLSILDRLLTLHWPASPAEQRAHWEACVAEVLEDWDCSRPPGVRVKTGDYQPPEMGGSWNLAQSNGGSDNHAPGTFTASGTRTLTITAPSTPDACALEGRRASVAPLKPFCYPIIHAQKPCEGSYLANWRKWGTGPVGVGDCRIPFAGPDDTISIATHTAEAHNASPCYGDSSADWTTGPHEAGRTPSNLLSYGDLLGDLTRYADLDAWCNALGLPEAAAELLSAGLIYAPKPSKTEKGGGLPEDYDAKRNPCAKPVALCAYLVTLATSEGQTVLDPFCGEAPVGVAATLLKRNFVGIELEPDFCQTARARIAHAQAAVESLRNLTSPDVTHKEAM